MSDASPALIRRTESRTRGGDGSPLFRRSWCARDPQRVIVLVHGFAEHSGRYDHVGGWLAARGCAVHAYDQRGHGRTPGPRGHARSFEVLLDDLSAFLAQVADEHPRLPLFLMGHSMGGLVVSAFLRERSPNLMGAVTSGALLALGPDVSRAKMALGRLLRRIWPRLALDSGIDPASLSRDPEVGRRYLEDPLVDTHMSAALGTELTLAIQRTAEGGGVVGVPILMLHGAADPLCPCVGSERFFASLSADVAPRSRLRIYPELRHEILNEPEWEEVLADLLHWVHDREGEAIPAALGHVPR